MFNSKSTYGVSLGDLDNKSSLHTYIDWKVKDFDSRAFLRGEINPPFELRFKDLIGRRVSDGVSCSLSLPIVSERVIQCLRDIEATGWKSIPITLRRKRTKKPVEGYHCLIITGRCGALDKRFAVEKKIPVEGHRDGFVVLEYGYRIEDEYFDGSDLFFPEGNSGLLCNERVYKALTALDEPLIDIFFEKVTEMLIV